MAITAQASSCDDKMVLDEARYYMTTDKIGKEMTEVSAGAVRENAVSLMGLLQAGLLSCGKDALTVKYKDFVAVAELSSDGKIIYEGHEFKTLSAFALSAIRRVNPTRKAVDGWLSVQHKECTLNHYRQQLKCSGISASSGNDRFLPIGTDELAIKDQDKEVLDAKRKRVKIGGDRNHLQQPKESLGEFVSNNKVETHSAKEGGGAAKEVRQRKRAKKEGVAARSGHAKKVITHVAIFIGVCGGRWAVGGGWVGVWVCV
ncbi:hypothetical protein CYMTET_9585 [Cymbomonas tetramitiformis]|uniref:RAMA domain-containing protein n=1 Tax=Cymbomonas tetramitiformis TaxID=36881 RepID=A0AAE0GR73_9CHLO|nr:hypothetical protein CYMTET_9585 [Cymbomonas tetramitiformis]